MVTFIFILLLHGHTTPLFYWPDRKRDKRMPKNWMEHGGESHEQLELPKRCRQTKLGLPKQCEAELIESIMNNVQDPGITRCWLDRRQKLDKYVDYYSFT